MHAIFSDQSLDISISDSSESYSNKRRIIDASAAWFVPRDVVGLVVLVTSTSTSAASKKRFNTG